MNKPENLISLKELVAIENLATHSPERLDEYLDRFNVSELIEFSNAVIESWEYHRERRAV